MDEFAEYYSIQTKNRDGFQQNFDPDIRVFKELTLETAKDLGMCRNDLRRLWKVPRWVAPLFKHSSASCHIRIRAPVLLSELPSVADFQTWPRSPSDDREARR